jgi:predicted CXXCH cytochrome family protein
MGSPWKLFVLAGCLHAAPDARVREYIDARVCATCHRQIADDYRQTGMARSFFRPTAENTIEDYTRQNTFYHALSDTHYAMSRRGGEFYQRRWQIGLGGVEINVEELRVDYILGSGNHARSYLHRTAAGTLIELPLGWYPDPKPGNWAMSPGSDSDHPRTRRFVAYKCMSCHNGIPRIPEGNEAPGSDPVFLGDLPEGIDCQRCHGPGGNHVRTAGSAGAKVADIRAAIVNPARLSSRLAMEVCMQCHLETTSGRIPAVIQRFNRGPFSFTPGESIGNSAIFFDHAPGTGHDEKFEAVSSVYRLRQSRCFTKSDGALTCQTCHNPHRVPRGAEAVNHYSAICRSCHTARQGSIAALGALVSSRRHPAATDCISCHMPKRRADDTPRMIMTDHRIQRHPPGKDLLAERPEPPPADYRGEVVPYYPSPLPQTAENALYRGVAQVGLGNNLAAGLPQLAREIEKQKPGESEFYIVLGDAWRNTGKQPEAVAAYQEAVRLNPRSVRALRALAAGLADAGMHAPAAEVLQKAIQLAPADPETWYRYGILDSTGGRVSDALDKVRKAIGLDPTLPEKSRRLAEILAQAGKPDDAQAALRDALRIDPYDDDAWDLAARIFAEKGQVAEATFHFERAIRLRPTSAPHLYDYALALARFNRFDEAQQRAEAAVRVDPNSAEAHELLGGLFERKPELAEAVREYRRALVLRPEVARVHLRLGTLLAQQGKTAEAAQHLREAARDSDPAIARQATRALERLGAR